MKGIKNIKDNISKVRNRFGFRKLSMGLTTVFLGSIFFFAGGQPVYASVNVSDNQETTEMVTSKAESTDDQVSASGSDSVRDTDSEKNNTNSTPKIGENTLQNDSEVETKEKPNDDTGSTINPEKEKPVEDKNSDVTSSENTKTVKDKNEISNDINSTSGEKEDSKETKTVASNDNKTTEGKKNLITDNKKKVKSTGFFNEFLRDLDDNKKQDQPIEGVIQQTVVGELPDIGLNNLTHDQLQNLETDLSDLGLGPVDDQSLSFDWLTPPDISKPGTSDGKVRINYTYTDYSTEDFPVRTKQVGVIKIKVDVREGRKKEDGEVRNRVTYIDQDDSTIVASYTWLGKKADNDSQEVENLGFDSYSMEKAVEGLGYLIVNNESDNADDAESFGTHDKNLNIFVKKVSEVPVTWGNAEQDGLSIPTFIEAYTRMDYNDPSNIIANIGVLPEGSKISWKTQPKFKKDGWLDWSIRPVIQIEEPTVDQPILLTLNDQDMNLLDTAGYVYDDVPIWEDGPTTIAENANDVSPMNFLSNPEEFARGLFGNERAHDIVKNINFKDFKTYILNSNRWKWRLAPDFQKAGYTIGFLKFVPLDTDLKDKTLSQYAKFVIENGFDYVIHGNASLRIHVLPNHVSTGKDVIRTIVVTDPISGKKTITYQTVHFTANGEQKIYDGPVENMQWDSGTNNGQWDEYIAPTIDGYTAIDSPVQLKKVDYDTKNTTVYITYTKNHTSGSGDDDKPTSPTPPDEPDNKKDDKTPTPPIQPTTPKELDNKQSKPEPEPVKTHHKKSTTKQKKHLSTPKTVKNWSENNAPHGENRTFNNNVVPHGQSAPANNVAPNSEHIDAHGKIIGSNGRIIGFVDANGKVHYVLPQTSDDQSNEKVLIAIGSIAVAISMIGLAGVKKRRRN